MLDAQVSLCMNQYTVVLEPDEDSPEWWAGAPSVVRCDDGTFYLAARMREGRSPRGRRGYEVRILRSQDGLGFEAVCSIRREDVPIGGFERPAILRDARTGLFKLYLCGPWQDGPWSILKLDDVADPRDFRAATCRPVLTAEASGLAGPHQFKDPFILYTRNRYHMLVIGTDEVERTYHFASDDGDRWRSTTEGPAFDCASWHDFYTRPACLLPVGVGYLFVYEGSHVTWPDPSYNIATGLAFTTDLRSFTDLTPDAPILQSTTPGAYHTWRYSHWLWVGEELWVYAEVARPNNTNEIRLFRLPKQP